ncbi:hypothetical protein KJ599_08020 [bacterium]|nr:hypothetical protein [bacterium]
MIFLKQMGNFKMKKNVSILLIVASILIVFSTLIFASETIDVIDHIKGKFPTIFNIYLTSLEDLDSYEKEFIDLLEKLPEEEQEYYAKEVYKNGFSLELLENAKEGKTIQEPTSSPLLPFSTRTPTLIPYEGPVNIYGYAKDVSGNPLEIIVAFEGFGVGDQGYVKTGSNGYYEKQVAGSIQYIVSVEPGRTQQIGKYSFPANYLPERKLVIRNGPEARVDFVVRDGGILWLKAYNESGIEMATRDFLDASKVGAFPVGTFPYGESIEDKYNGFPLFWGWIENSNKNIPLLMLPPNEEVEIWVVWRLPEVGTTFLHADNDGKGFTVKIENITPINLVYEFARTEYRETSLQYEQFQEAGFTFSKVIADSLEIAHRNMAHADSFHQQGLENESAVYSYKVLMNVIKAREKLVLEKAQLDIEKYRKGDVTLIFVDDRGNTLSNSKVEYKQNSHDFIFSSGWPTPQQYESLRAAGIEYSFFEAWWGEVETNDGVYNFPDSALAMQEQAGLGYIMKTGLWLLPNYPPAIPKFAATMSPSELSSQAYQYSYDYVSHYKGKIKMYNALGEPEFSQAYQFTLDELIDITESSSLGAKSADPNLPTYILIAHPIFKSLLMTDVNYSVNYDQFGKVLPEAFSFPSPTRSGYEFLLALEEAGVDFNAIGLEYAFGAPYPSIDLGLFENTLNFYSMLNKKVFVDEIFYPTMEEYPDIDKWWEHYGGWHEGFTDKTQADWAASTLTIAFSKPYVNGYQWGTTNDGPPEYYLNGNGLFHKDKVTPRLALYAIGDLIKSWTTTGNDITDNTGSLTFRGFGGDYYLAITTDDGQVYHANTHVTEQQNNTIKITVDTTPPVLKSVSTEQIMVKNGAAIEIRVDAGEAGLVVTADVSQLDSTKTNPILLNQEQDGTYKGSVTISLANTTTNGIKTLALNAVDNWGNVGTSTIEIELKNPPPILDTVPPNDNFDGTVLDVTRWRIDNSGGGVVKQDGRLIVSTDRAQAFSIARARSVWGFTGDFDIQVDFQIGKGWSLPVNDHLDGAYLGVSIAGQDYHITRLIISDGTNKFYVWSTTGTLKGEILKDALTGKYRLIRAGTTLALLYDTGSGWQELANVSVPSSPAQVYLGNGSINASQAFTTYFDNFHINLGLTTYIP